MPDDDEDTIVSFPFSTSDDICVFGGHDSWLKAIRPMLPNVKFVGRFISPHPDLIKNADVIWLQTNSMSHVYFNNVISVARKHNVTCKYFFYASATIRSVRRIILNIVFLLSPVRSTIIS